MKELGLIIISICLPFNSFSQAPDIEWQNTIGGVSSDELTICQTRDGGYIVGGTSQSGISGDNTGPYYGGNDYWIMKIDSLGLIQWQISYGGSSSDNLIDLCQTIDGGYLLGGYSFSDSSGIKTMGSFGSFDYWIIKIDSLGNIEWQNDIGGSGYDYLTSIDQCIDGGYILGGYSNSPISGNKNESNFLGSDDYWIVKVDSIGDIEWQNNIGGAGQDWLYCLTHDTDGGFIICGKSSSGISGDKTELNLGSEDYWVIKLDSSGDIQWQNTIGGGQLDRPYKIIKTFDSGYMVGGMSSSGISGDKTEPSQGDYDYWVVKLDSSGDILWQNDIGGNLADGLMDLKQTNDEGYILGGYSSSGISGDKTQNNIGFEDYWIIKLDNFGNIIWQKTIGGWSSDYLEAIQQTQDLGYFAGGWSESPESGDKTEDNVGGSDFWIMKLYPDSCVNSMFYADIDGDGFGNSSDSTLACFPPLGYVLNNSDCNDTSFEINPSSVENCNGIDDNCNGDSDEGLPLNIFFADVDNDGYGDALEDTLSCQIEISGYVTDSTDCNDENILIHEALVYFADEDHDTYGNPVNYISHCDIIPPIGFVADSTDCDDTNPYIYPGNTEVLNGIDDNCNDTIDEGFNSIFDGTESDFIIYPNPNTGSFIIKPSNLYNTPIIVEIYDVSGNKVYSKSSNVNELIVVKLTNLSSGLFEVYILSDQFILHKMIIIQYP